MRFISAEEWKKELFARYANEIISARRQKNITYCYIFLNLTTKIMIQAKN